MTVALIVEGSRHLIGTDIALLAKNNRCGRIGWAPVALSGRVYCKAGTTMAATQPGDLLATSARPGHAMKVLDHELAMGAVIGKAMTPLAQGEEGLVLVLVTLQ